MKKSYHTDIALQYKLGILHPEIESSIPSSTKHNWKNKDLSTLVGAEYVNNYEQNLELLKGLVARKSLLRITKALYSISCTYSRIFETNKDQKKILRQSSELIIHAIDEIRPAIGFTRALKAFHITYQRYYAWKRKEQCKNSAVGICRKTNYNQLTAKDITTIRTYLLKPEYLHWGITNVYYQILRDKAAFFSRTNFYKYVNQLQLKRSKPRKKTYHLGIRTDAP